MVLDRAAVWRVDDFVGDDVGDVCHDAEIGVERSEDVDAFLVSHPLELPDGDVTGLGGSCERFPSTASVRCGENTDNVVLFAVCQSLEDRLSECGLTDQGDFHVTTLILEIVSATKCRAVALSV